MVKILKLEFRRDFEAGVWSVFCCACLFEVMKLNLGRNSEAKFGQDADIGEKSRVAGRVQVG